ncbi:hypothetical protein [Sphaerotilus sp.]|uniref:hypothetical protein n=1 Tax=Sphaerotilus sp. TaxID=2093942 RepID=UPI0025CED006|nr:hypothetical protein [Sphaerotilus sp.]
MFDNIESGPDVAGGAASPARNLNTYVPAAPVQTEAKRTQDLAAGLATVLALLDRDELAVELAEFDGIEVKRAFSAQDRCELMQMSIAVARDIAESAARHRQWADRHAVVVSGAAMVLPAGEDLS